MATSDRIPCEVPFCRRTASKKQFPDPGTIIICGKHWRLGDTRWRKANKLAERRYKATGNPKYRMIAHYCWARVLKQAIERSAGI